MSHRGSLTWASNDLAHERKTIFPTGRTQTVFVVKAAERNREEKKSSCQNSTWQGPSGQREIEGRQRITLIDYATEKAGAMEPRKVGLKFRSRGLAAGDRGREQAASLR